MHRIRLRKPWIRSIAPSVDQPIKVDVPDPNPLSAKPGQIITYQRNFNLPTGLSHADQVWIDVDAITGQNASVHLNDQLLYDGPAQGPHHFEVTPSLLPSNQISMTIEADHTGIAALSGAVHLRISTPPAEHRDE